MAAAIPSAVPLEYLRIYDLPPASTLPSELISKKLYHRVEFKRAKSDAYSSASPLASKDASGHSGAGPSGPVAHGDKKGKSGGFNYSKALKAALQDAGSSVTSRGDGKFEGGKDFAVSDAPGGRAKFVHLTPDALAAGNAERTLQELDKLQQRAGSRASGGSAGASMSSAGPFRPGTVSGPHPSVAAATRSAQIARAAALAAAGRALTDLSDEYESAAAATASASGGGSRGPGGSAAPGSVSGAAGGGGGGAAPALRVPEHSVRELPAPPGASGCPGLLEVSVLLPDVESPAGVDVWLGAGGVLQVAVPGKYSLKLELPYKVVDDTSKAKWSKAKRRLTLTLARQS